MSLLRFFAAASAVLILAACQGGGPVDASYPTVSELDRLDTQWGLAPRKSRGAPKRSYYSPTPSRSAAVESAPAAAAEPPPREMMREVSTPAPQLDPATVNSLR